MSKKMSNTRILKLATMYGPFVRFSPDGNEAVDDAIKDAENADLKDNAEFDKVRQQADMEKANAAKAREKAEEATTQLSEANGQLEALRQELSEAKANAKTAGIDIELNESDYSDTDVNLVKSINAIKLQLKAKDEEISGLNKKAQSFEASEAQKQKKSTEEAQYNELLNDMDVDYGPEFRNTAVKAFEAKVAAGEVKGGPAKATRILEKCYKDAVKAVADKEADKKKNGVRLDSGTGGGSGESFSGVTLTAGSLEDVAAQAGKVLNKTGT